MRHAIEQGSPDWYKARLGIPTASNFHRIITPTLKASDKSKLYMCRLICERLTGQSMDDQLGHIEWVERGKELEPQAAAQFEYVEELELEPGGFVTDTDCTVGASPDRLIKGRNEAVEIKCLSMPKHMFHLLYGISPEHYAQVQGQLYVGDFDAVWFYSWHPSCPPYTEKVEPNPAWVEAFKPLLDKFVKDLENETHRALSLGSYSHVSEFSTPFETAYGDSRPH